MSIYNGKHVVFEEVGVESTAVAWNSASNTDGDGCSNNYEIANIRTITLYNFKSKVSVDLQDIITDTTIQTAKNGLGQSLISTTDKWFIGAETEVNRAYNSTNIEMNTLIIWDYWISHTSNANHIKYDSGNTAKNWWTRSPSKDSGNGCVYINNSGASDAGNIASDYNYSPCFAL